MQKGIVSIPLVLVGVLVLASVGVGGYYFFEQQKIKSINSFDDCAKHYPVMLSYPGQCNTPYGRHFVQELSDAEKQKLKQPQETTPSSGKSDEGDLFNIFVSDNGKFSVNYPRNWSRIEGGIKNGDQIIYLRQVSKSIEDVKRGYNRGDATLASSGVFTDTKIAEKIGSAGEVTFSQHDGYGDYEVYDKWYVILVATNDAETVSLTGKMELKSLVDQIAPTVRTLK
jgi:hypothetical protein